MRIKATINSQQTGDISSIDQTVGTSNVGALSEPTKPGGYKGFQLSSSVDKPTSSLNGTYKLFSAGKGYPGWLSKTLSDAEGFFDPSPSLTVYFNEPTNHLHLVFDRELNEYASMIVLTPIGATSTSVVYNISSEVVLQFEPTTALSITLVQWNKPYKSAKITFVDDDRLLEFVGGAIESLECSEQAWGASFGLTTGIIQQYADLKIRDSQKILRRLSDMGALMRFMPINFYVEHDGDWQHLGEYVSDKWSIDGTNNLVSVSCNDYTRNFERYFVDVKGTNLTVKRIFELIHEQVPEIEIIPKPETYIRDPFTGEQVSMDTYLESCVCGDVYFQAVRVDEVIDQVCDRWMLKVYWEPTLKKYVAMEAW